MRRALLLTVLLGFLAPGGTLAQFKGSDGRFDVSDYLAKRGAFLPVPMIITDPAVGYGLGLGAIFFHGGNPLQQERYVPPSITGALGFYTQNGSKGAALAHFGVFKNDHIRYVGIGGSASLNLDYWGTGTPRRYNVAGALIIQRLQFRIGNSPLMLGGEWSFSKQRSRFDLAPQEKNSQKDSGIGVIGEYETLDNLFSATRGLKARILAKTFSKNLGGDNDRQRLDAEAFGYVPISRLTVGWRTDFAFSDGETPFYLLPYLDMRGLPALKYAGKHTALGELEARWSFDRRWSGVGFGGVGYAKDTRSKQVGTYGAGFRYLIAERLGVHTGIDYARGPDDYAVYLIFGSAWR